MFDERDLPADVAAVREAHAPDALVLDVERDFETMPPEAAEDLGFVVDALDPLAYPESWLPPDAPAVLQRYAGGTFTIGAPGDGSVAWTRQTEPPTVFVKPRVEGSPADFVDFLVAAALVEVGLEVPVPGGPDPDPSAAASPKPASAGDADGADAGSADAASATDVPRPVPEQFLGFFGERYRELAAATPLGPADTYQLAAALYDAWLGLHTREVFAAWVEDRPRLGGAWQDAGERIEPRLGDLSGEVARGETDFAAAAELACAAVQHAVGPSASDDSPSDRGGGDSLELPPPFSALDSVAYRDGGAPYAVRWAEKTFDALAE